MLSRISLLALHVEQYHIKDDIYVATHPVIPQQNRTLRVRARRRQRRRASVTPRWAGNIDLDVGGTVTNAGMSWDHSLAWVSPPLSGREHAEMRVQAYVGLDVAGLSSREEVESFVATLGFRHSHTYTRTGHLFHLPVPGQTTSTLHLTVTRILSPDDKHADHATEPYLVQLQPGKPVGAVASSRGEPNLQDTMRIMQDVAQRIDGLEWETGR
ncbi:hypothetical protein VHUM_01602 [Vanrija humicola]|uniref:Mediator complex subunit 18 n=1 Tax=Vanrija humicola TaxID=5417 RepID=A0A7D8V8C1_VANHU|nr:hypothetical protein VHUM_01602 [Vanrija humicola]